ncbi:MAG: hypothetical protein AB7E59_01225, partial [Pusillimonas sp.]
LTSVKVGHRQAFIPKRPATQRCGAFYFVNQQKQQPCVIMEKSNAFQALAVNVYSIRYPMYGASCRAGHWLNAYIPVDAMDSHGNGVLALWQ